MCLRFLLLFFPPETFFSFDYAWLTSFFPMQNNYRNIQCFFSALTDPNIKICRHEEKNEQKVKKVLISAPILPSGSWELKITFYETKRGVKKISMRDLLPVNEEELRKRDKQAISQKKRRQVYTCLVEAAHEESVARQKESCQLMDKEATRMEESSNE